jgi:hypothetical protein
MDSLADRLKGLGVQFGIKNVQKNESTGIQVPIEAVVPGSYKETIYGPIFCSEKDYSPDEKIGAAALRITNPLVVMAEWAKAGSILTSDYNNFVFLDTETTGLSGGTGTCAFMIGVGRLTPGGFRLAQFFMRNPAEESALLASLVEFLYQFEVVVTFNGKSFDIPLLNNRFTIQGLTNPFEGITHLDMLHLARRLWKDRLPDRSLHSLEESVLGIERSANEVPGWMVPELYFEYLRTGDSRPMEGIFYHNAMDILSLAALFNYTAGLLAEPLQHANLPGLDLVAIAKLHEDLGHIETAIKLYETGINRDIPEEFFWKTVERYARLFKRQGDHARAIQLWEKAANHNDLYAYFELAKVFEHELQELIKAAEWTEAGICAVNENHIPEHIRQELLPDLERRLARIKRKLKK